MQHLHDRYKQTGRYSHLLALANGVHRFLEQDDPTVEIAYLKAKLADVEAERDQAAVKALTTRAEAAEQANQRVRECAQQALEFADRTMDDNAAQWARVAAADILRALDGGAS